MSTPPAILVLGAYGLAGWAIVARLAARTPYAILAAGRDAAKLRALAEAHGTDRLRTSVFSAGDSDGLRRLCGEAAFVINAIGPYPQHGADIARVVLECGLPYVDCANEQSHYRQLELLDGLARERGLPLITAAGLIPGLSTLLIAKLLGDGDGDSEVDCYYGQRRHAYAASGLASIMGGVLEAADTTRAPIGGRLMRVRLGQATCRASMPAPLGDLLMVEAPTIDALALHARFPGLTYRTWIHLGDLPPWLLTVIRWLRPHQWAWSYRLIERIARKMNDDETARAIAAGAGPEAALKIEVYRGDTMTDGEFVYTDGASPTACLPVHLADAWLRGGLRATGLLTPLDVVAPDDAVLLAEDVTLRFDWGSGG